jgi:hypothetical protein
MATQAANQRAPRAIGLIYVTASADDKFIAEEKFDYDRLAQKGGLALTRVVVNRVSVSSELPFKERKPIIEVIQAVQDGEASVVIARSPADISPYISELAWFNEQIKRAGGQFAPSEDALDRLHR